MTQNVSVGQVKDELPAVTIQFFNAQRERLDVKWLGPYQGSSDWTEDGKEFKVPRATREAIISVGLFGGIGTVSYDDIKIEIVR